MGVDVLQTLSGLRLCVPQFTLSGAKQIPACLMLPGMQCQAAFLLDLPKLQECESAPSARPRAPRSQFVRGHGRPSCLRICISPARFISRRPPGGRNTRSTRRAKAKTVSYWPDAPASPAPPTHLGGASPLTRSYLWPRLPETRLGALKGPRPDSLKPGWWLAGWLAGSCTRLCHGTLNVPRVLVG